MPLPVFYRDRETRLLERVNQHYADLFTGDKADLIGQPLETIFGEVWAEEIRQFDDALLTSDGQTQSLERDLTFPMAGQRRIISHKAAVKDADAEIQGLVGVLMDVTEAHDLRLELERLATTDPLTGLANRRMFMERSGAELIRYRRHKRVFSVLMIDADDFKLVNDTYGHDAGDRVLLRLAEIAASGLRTALDLPARFGGEEFVILFSETDAQPALQVAERLRQTFEATSVLESDAPDARTVRFTASIGVATVCDEDQTVESILKRADKALYRAKEGGRNRVVAEPDLTQSG